MSRVSRSPYSSSSSSSSSSEDDKEVQERRHGSKSEVKRKSKKEWSRSRSRDRKGRGEKGSEKKNESKMSSEVYGHRGYVNSRDVNPRFSVGDSRSRYVLNRRQHEGSGRRDIRSNRKNRRSRSWSRESRSRKRKERRSRSRSGESKSRKKIRRSRSVSKSRSKRKEQASRSKRSRSRSKKSRSPSRNKKSKSRSPSKDKKYRTPSSQSKSPSKNKKSRSRSPNMDKKSRTPSRDKKSRSPSRDKKSRSPSRDKKSRSPSRDKKSRSPSRDKKSRSPSRDKKSSSPSSDKKSRSLSSTKKSRSPRTDKVSRSSSRDKESRSLSSDKKSRSLITSKKSKSLNRSKKSRSSSRDRKSRSSSSDKNSRSRSRDKSETPIRKKPSDKKDNSSRENRSQSPFGNEKRPIQKKGTSPNRHKTDKGLKITKKSSSPVTVPSSQKHTSSSKIDEKSKSLSKEKTSRSPTRDKDRKNTGKGKSPISDRKQRSPSRDKRSRSISSDQTKSKSPSSDRKRMKPSSDKKRSLSRDKQIPSLDKQIVSPIKDEKVRSSSSHKKSKSPSSDKISKSPSNDKKSKSPSSDKRSKSHSSHKKNESPSKEKKSKSRSKDHSKKEIKTDSTNEKDRSMGSVDDIQSTDKSVGEVKTSSKLAAGNITSVSEEYNLKGKSKERVDKREKEHKKETEKEVKEKDKTIPKTTSEGNDSKESGTVQERSKKKSEDEQIESKSQEKGSLGSTTGEKLDKSDKKETKTRKHESSKSSEKKSHKSDKKSPKIDVVKDVKSKTNDGKTSKDEKMGQSTLVSHEEDKDKETPNKHDFSKELIIPELIASEEANLDDLQKLKEEIQKELSFEENIEKHTPAKGHTQKYDDSKYKNSEGHKITQKEKVHSRREGENFESKSLPWAADFDRSEASHVLTESPTSKSHQAKTSDTYWNKYADKLGIKIDDPKDRDQEPPRLSDQRKMNEPKSKKPHLDITRDKRDSPRDSRGKESDKFISDREVGERKKHTSHPNETLPKNVTPLIKKPVLDPLTTRTGGAYIPPAKLKMMQDQITDKSSAAFQRLAWEALKKAIIGLVNKVNVSNIDIIVKELFKENIIRGRGVFIRALMQAQAFSPTFTHVYAAVIAAINSKFPQIGELLLHRLVIQLRRGIKKNDKSSCMASCKFVAHLINQQVAHEVVALELLTMLLEKAKDITDESELGEKARQASVELAIAFLKECGMKLSELTPKGLMIVMETLRNILHEGKLDPRYKYMIEVLMAIKKENFKDFPSVLSELDLVDEEDQFTHIIELDGKLNGEEILNIFKEDKEYEVNEAKYKELKEAILGDDEDSSSGEDGDDSDSDDSENEEEENEAKNETILDRTETNLVAFRRTVYLTIQSSLDVDECAHKLLKGEIKPGWEEELCNMIIDCCAQQRTYMKFYGLLAQRFCMMNRIYQEPFETIFKDAFETCHRLEIEKIRNVAMLFAHLLFSDAISWEVFSCIHLNQDETTSSSRVFLKILFEELANFMGLQKLNERLREPTLSMAYEGLLPRDNPINTRFAINFFTTIGLGGLTDDLREFLRSQPKPMAVVAPVPHTQKERTNSTSSSTSSSSSSTKSSSSSSSESSSNDSESDSSSSDSSSSENSDSSSSSSSSSSSKDSSNGSSSDSSSSSSSEDSSSSRGTAGKGSRSSKKGKRVRKVSKNRAPTSSNVEKQRKKKTTPKATRRKSRDDRTTSPPRQSKKKKSRESRDRKSLLK